MTVMLDVIEKKSEVLNVSKSSNMDMDLQELKSLVASLFMEENVLFIYDNCPYCPSGYSHSIVLCGVVPNCSQVKTLNERGVYIEDIQPEQLTVGEMIRRHCRSQSV